MTRIEWNGNHRVYDDGLGLPHAVLAAAVIISVAALLIAAFATGFITRRDVPRFVSNDAQQGIRVCSALPLPQPPQKR